MHDFFDAIFSPCFGRDQRAGRRRLFAGFLVAMFAAGAAHAQSDEIVDGTGIGKSGRITKMSPTLVVMKVNGIDRDFPVNEIKKISFGGEPQLMRQARNAAMGGRFEDALKTFSEIMENQLKGEYAKQDHQFFKAYCQTKLALAGSADWQQAGKALSTFVKQYPQNYHYYLANELIGDLLVANGLHGSAKDYYERVAAAPWPDYQLRATILSARALIFQKKYAEAIPKLDEVIGKRTDKSPQSARQKLLAEVAKVKCMAHTGMAAQGIQAIQKIIAENDPEDKALFGRAYNALGVCQVKMKKNKDALLAFLHVDILFYQDPEIHAEALFYLAQLWGQVNKPDRAVRARGLLKSRYAGSHWNQLKS